MSISQNNPWQKIDFKKDEEYVCPKYLKDDRDIIDEENDRSHKAKSKRKYKLRTDLFPMPFVGEIEESEIFLLQANPGASLGTATNEPPSKKCQLFESYRVRVEKCLRQNFSEGDYPFYFLDPEIWWVHGSYWWRETLGDLIEAVAINQLEVEGRDGIYKMLEEGTDFRPIYKLTSKKICAVELYGYRSKNYRRPQEWFESCEFQAQIVNHAINQDKQIILMRAEKDWKKLLTDSDVELSGEELAQYENCMTLSSKQNSKISSNNLESDLEEPLQFLVNLIID